MKIISRLATLLDSKSIIFGLAIFNFVLIFLKAAEHAADGMFPQSRPWYVNWDIAIYPHLLLIAAFGLWLSKSWGYVLAMLLSAHPSYRGVSFLAHLIVEPNDSWMLLYSVRNFLLLQFALGTIIFCYATFCLGRDVYHRRTFAHHGV